MGIIKYDNEKETKSFNFFHVRVDLYFILKNGISEKLKELTKVKVKKKNITVK